MSDLDLPIALARELVHRSGALKASVMVAGAVVEVERLGPVRVVEEAGERELPHDSAATVALPALPALRRLPPFEVDAAEGRVAGPLGGLQMLARALRDLAALLDPNAVVAADFATTDPATPLGVAARARQEPVVVLLGDDAFELDV